MYVAADTNTDITPVDLNPYTDCPWSTNVQVRNREDTLTCARHMHTDSLAPIFLTSSVTGSGLDLVRLFYNLLPQRINWHGPLLLVECLGFWVLGLDQVLGSKVLILGGFPGFNASMCACRAEKAKEPVEFIIDETFGVRLLLSFLICPLFWHPGSRCIAIADLCTHGGGSYPWTPPSTGRLAIIEFI